MNQLPNIDFKKPIKNPTIDAETSEFELPFYKDVEYFSNLDNFVGFIKAVERLVRTSTYYSRYIKYLKEDIGLTACQVLSNIEDEEYATVEMHHGPILTLFDYVSIITDWMLATGEKINSFRVADILLEEHFLNNVQVVMLSKTVHEQVHENNVFINLNQAFGSLDRFLTKYRKGLHPEQIQKINKYIKMSTEYDSFDKDVLKLSGVVKKWNKENGEDE
jgi:hypothetical protein